MQLTVIVPVYNVAPYLQRAIHSLQQQTCADFALLLADDGSADGSAAICDALAKQDARITVLHLPHGGVSAARNAALQKVQTPFVTFMDADDYTEPTWLESLLHAAQNADMACCGMYFETQHRRGAVRDVYVPQQAIYDRAQMTQHLARLWDAHMLYNLWNKVYRTQIIREGQLQFDPAVSYGEDMRFTMQYMALCNRFSFVAQPLYHYVRYRQGAASAHYRQGLFALRCEEYDIFVRHFAQFDAQSAQDEAFLARRHAERVVGCIENLYLHGCPLYGRSRRAKISEIINHPLTRKIADKVRFTSRKMRLLWCPVRKRQVHMAAFLCAGVAFVQQHCATLFFYLKQRR